MFEQEYVPDALVVGIRYNEFWEMNPKILKLHFESFKKSQEIHDQHMWMQGQYIRMAIASTVGNMFSDKKSQKIEYPDKPYSSGTTSSGEMTEEEKMRETEKLFATLEIMKRNFELDHK